VTARTALPWAALALGLLACGRVPEAQLRDEQARSRRYRDAYESALQENGQLKDQLKKAKAAPACPAEPPKPAQ
jgi:hypothetical protein